MGIWLVRMVETAAIALLEDLVEVTTGIGVERFEALIVEDEELDAGEATQNAGIATVTAVSASSKRVGNPLIETSERVSLYVRHKQAIFAHAGRPAQDEIVVRVLSIRYW